MNEWDKETIRLLELSELILEGVENYREKSLSSFGHSYITNRIAQANALANLATARNGVSHELRASTE